MKAVRNLRDGRTAPARIRAMKRCADPVRRHVGLILEGFQNKRRTEGAFYLHFCALAPMQSEALKTLWGVSDDWRVFRRICRFFAV